VLAVVAISFAQTDSGQLEAIEERTRTLQSSAAALDKKLDDLNDRLIKMEILLNVAVGLGAVMVAILGWIGQQIYQEARKSGERDNELRHHAQMLAGLESALVTKSRVATAGHDSSEA
jgi:hypothetical protein